MAEQDQQPSTPEAASMRLAELHADSEWAAARLSNGPNSAQSREEDQLQRIIIGAAPDPVATAGGEMTPEAAAAKIKELMSDPKFGQALLKGGNKSREANQLDSLQRIVAAAPESTAERTPAQARAAELDVVPATPEGYAIDWGVDAPPPEGVTAISGWMHGAGLTKAEAATMTFFAARDVTRWMQMGADQREQQKTDTLARFNKMHGEAAPAMLDGARQLVAELCLKDPTLKSFLEDSGAGASLGVIEALATAAKRRRG